MKLKVNREKQRKEKTTRIYQSDEIVVDKRARRWRVIYSNLQLFFSQSSRHDRRATEKLDATSAEIREIDLSSFTQSDTQWSNRLA